MTILVVTAISIVVVAAFVVAFFVGVALALLTGEADP